MEAQLLLLTAVKDVASSLGGLIDSTRLASGKSVQDPSMENLKASAKVREGGREGGRGRRRVGGRWRGREGEREKKYTVYVCIDMYITVHEPRPRQLSFFHCLPSDFALLPLF